VFGLIAARSACRLSAPWHPATGEITARESLKVAILSACGGGGRDADSCDGRAVLFRVPDGEDIPHFDILEIHCNSLHRRIVVTRSIGRRCSGALNRRDVHPHRDHDGFFLARKGIAPLSLCPRSTWDRVLAVIRWSRGLCGGAARRGAALRAGSLWLLPRASRRHGRRFDHLDGHLVPCDGCDLPHQPRPLVTLAALVILVSIAAVGRRAGAQKQGYHNTCANDRKHVLIHEFFLQSYAYHMYPYQFIIHFECYSGL
jgi:hypothetical protein